jgi:endonuclease YncB( thermonuclease family)
MRRRDFLTAVGVGASGLLTALPGRATTRDDRIESLVFDSAGSLLAADGTQLTDDSLVAVYAAETATNTEADGNGDAVGYEGPVPLVAVDGDVLAFGGPFATARNFQYGNEEFLLNALEEHVDGERVLFDEGHGQFYDLSKYASFRAYAEDAGYELEATTDLAADLSGAAALFLTSPSQALSTAETDAVRTFLDRGGALFVFHQSDFRNFDETANLNALATDLDLAVRFNDDQVVDATENAGEKFTPVTDRFTAAAEPYLRARDGLELAPDERYEVAVREVTDGDTVTVEFDDGRREDIRVLGVDTAETPKNQQFEREQEWEGIESLSVLGQWGTRATEFGRSKLAGETVTLSFDAESQVRDPFGRLLGYIEYDDGLGTRLYNRELVAEGQARVYGSGFGRHDDFWRAERAAREADRGIWAESDPAASAPIRTGPVEELFVPKAVTVRSEWGELDRDRAPVLATSEASQTFEDGAGDGWGIPWLSAAALGVGAEDTDDPDFGDPDDGLGDPEFGDPGGIGGIGDGDEPIGGGFDWGWGDVLYQDLPLVGVDEDTRVGVVGGLLIDERYEQAEDFAVDTSEYDNFTFLTNLIDYLADRDGDVLIEGGHGQFGADYALSNEDAAYYGRYLEGQGIGFDQANDLTEFDLSGYRAVVVTTPAAPFTYDEAAALQAFAQAGGAVILMGAATAPGDARGRLNDLARELGTDLRINGDAVEDQFNNVNGDPSLPTTTRFDDSFPLFGAYDGDGGEREDESDRGDGDCATTERTRETGTVSAGERAAFVYDTRTERPCSVTVSLSGSGADLDLYLTTDGRTPSQTDYDRRSWSFGPEEEIELGDVSPGQSLGIAVTAFSGSGEYTVVVEERG